MTTHRIPSRIKNRIMSKKLNLKTDTYWSETSTNRGAAKTKLIYIYGLTEQRIGVLNWKAKQKWKIHIRNKSAKQKQFKYTKTKIT